MRGSVQISVQEVSKILQSDSDPKLLDIREPTEYEIVHLPGALLATQEVMADVLNNWERDAEIICYCHHGVRSMSAANYLIQQGFENVRSMQGGIDAWSQEIDPETTRY